MEKVNIYLKSGQKFTVKNAGGIFEELVKSWNDFEAGPMIFNKNLSIERSELAAIERLID